MILGGGPNRIGQGIEFDYCCVHAAIALKELGFETIIVNCNPETVSTDYDTSDKLYFEPLTLEDVLSIYHKEKPLGVIAQFGGQTPLNLAADLKKYGVNILGTTPETIDMAEDRDLFRAMMDKLQIPMPESGMAVTVEDALEIANKIGYPVMVRPSYVLGGRGMEVVHDDEAMTFYMRAAVGVTPDRPILIDRFLHHATECEADAISDGENVFVPAVTPTMAAPAFTSATPAPANSSGVMRYTVFFPSSSGSPAFGFAMSGIVAYSAILSTRGTISIGPVEQFTPIASTPRDCSTTTAVSGGVPNNVRPSSL